MSPLIDQSGNQWVSNLTLISPINVRPSKRVSVYQLIHSEINQQSTNNNVGQGASVVNQPIPLPLNDDTAVSGRNGVSMSESEVSAVSDILGECWMWLASKWKSGCKCTDLIRAILDILYQVLRNSYRVLGL